MENKETWAPCTYQLRVTLFDAEETFYISMTDPDGTLDDYCVHY